MTSLPNPSTTPILMSTPIPSTNNNNTGKRHRHRRSAAISGDFDAMGLGLFSPPSSASKKPSLPDFDVDDKQFQFDNDEDFSDKAKSLDFSFPNIPTSNSPNSTASPHFHTTGAPSPRNSNTFSNPPSRLLYHQSHNSLNSPIRLGRKSYHSVHIPPKSAFFLSEETGNHPIPDAVIDLDEVLNAKLRIDSPSSHSIHDHAHSKSELTMIPPFEMFTEETPLASPYYRLYPSPFTSSPLSTSNNLLFQQPIQEQYTDDIEETEEQQNEIVISSIKQPMSMDDVNSGRISASVSASDLEQEFANPHTVLGELYANDSANSSCSSLRSGSTAARNVLNPLIEKTFSNDSMHNNYHYGAVSTPTQGGGKRSGAKASRYQSFYDQSYKISNALKISSTESVNIVRTTSNDGSFQLPKEVRILGHSSSLPSLKTVLNKRSNQKLRFNEIRITSNSSNNSTTSNNSQVRKLSPPIQVKQKNSNFPILGSTNNTPPNFGPQLILIMKNVSNSPVSVNSEVSLTIISSNATIQTEHSSIHDPQMGSFASKVSEQNTISDLTTPQIIISSEEENSSFSSITVNNNEKHIYQDINYLEQKNSSSDNGNSMSTISMSIVDAHSNTSPTGSASANCPVSTSSPSVVSMGSIDNISPKKKNSKNSPRRPLSPRQESFLKQTQIPAFTSRVKASHSGLNKQNITMKSEYFELNENPDTRKQNMQPLRNQNFYEHRKSQSVSLSSGKENDVDDVRSLRLNSSAKRNNRFISWLKRK